MDRNILRNEQGGKNLFLRRKFNRPFGGGGKRKHGGNSGPNKKRKANDDGVKKAKTLLHNHKNNVQNAFQAWIAEGECIKTLEGHSGCVMSVAIDGDRIVSGSDDGTLKVWDIEVEDVTARVLAKIKEENEKNTIDLT